MDRDLKRLAQSYPHLVVSHSDFTFGETIGVGGSSTVRLGIDKDGQERAIKEFGCITESQYAREIEAMIISQGSFVIPILGFSVEKPFIISMPYFQNGDLEHKMFEEKDPTNKLIWAMAISYGMANIHKNHITFGDFKPLNILIGDDYIPVISDFGSVLFEPNNKLTIYSIPWASPELIAKNEVSPKSDVFAFGLLLLELATGNKMNRRNYTLYEIASSADKIIEIPDEIEPHNLIERCLSLDPNDRPTMIEIFNEFHDGISTFEEADLGFATAEIDEILDNYQPE